MTDTEREQERLYVAALLASFVSFKRCGPASEPETDRRYHRGSFGSGLLRLGLAAARDHGQGFVAACKMID